MENALLRQGYRLLAPSGSATALTASLISTAATLSQAPLIPFAASTPPAFEMPMAPQRDVSLAACEKRPLYQQKSLGRSMSAGSGIAQVAPPGRPSAPIMDKCPKPSAAGDIGWEPQQQWAIIVEADRVQDWGFYSLITTIAGPHRGLASPLQAAMGQQYGR
jgi:hypothetical protein